MTELPQWLMDNLPEIAVPYRLTIVNDELTLIDPEGTSKIVTLDQVNGSIATRVGLKIDKEVYEKFAPNQQNMRMLFYPINDGKGTSGMIMDFTDDDRHSSLLESYKDFLQVAAEYEADPTDFYNSYRFLDRHPSFWYVNGDLPTTHWNQEDLFARLSLYIFKNEDTGGVVYNIEGGEHVAPEYKERYYNYRLDVRESSFENAVIAFAANVRKFYNNDGTDVTPEPEHRVPKWVSDLEGRLADVDDTEDQEETNEGLE